MEQLQQCRVLIVEDYADCREWLAIALTEVGAKVRTVAFASEALELLSEFQPDVLLCNLRLPQMDGYALLESIRSQPAARLPAIAMSTAIAPLERQQALTAGFQDYLSKPIAFEAVIEAVKRLAQPIAPSLMAATG